MKVLKFGIKILAVLLIFAGPASVSGNSGIGSGDYGRSIEGPPGGYGSLSWEYETINRTSSYTIYTYHDTSREYWKKVYYDLRGTYIKTTYGSL
ncbi:hypothetical protein LCM10_19870 [Rossellomorea aquimaris]|uniref:hypothetical protein n=1 Tax=Rossellomorea aquimaris TaxID=189382 RepID=UPI001CD7B4C9|nr:hypothetical protein [Rossellomorea aquimaris]MCA1057206.1 hypothetical protein [Rossellomorea aquimaris]